MPGRPKMMAKKITELEAKAEEVCGLIEEYIPRQYEMHEGPLEETDPLCQSWNLAVFAATDAMNRMSDLAILLRAKAGIPESEPSEACLAAIAKTTEQRKNPQAVACCEQGTNGDTESMGAVDIPQERV